jgi:hypothetical protein
MCVLAVRLGGQSQRRQGSRRQAEGRSRKRSSRRWTGPWAGMRLSSRPGPTENPRRLGWRGNLMNPMVRCFAGTGLDDICLARSIQLRTSQLDIAPLEGPHHPPPAEPVRPGRLIYFFSRSCNRVVPLRRGSEAIELIDNLRRTPSWSLFLMTWGTRMLETS